MRDKYLNFARELKKKTMEHEGDGDTSCNWCTWNNTRKIGKRTENKRTSGDHTDIRIIKIGQNTEGSPGDLRRLAVTPLV